MKCFTLSDKEVTPGINLDGLPKDKTLSDKEEVNELKVIALLPDREGINPEELFVNDLGRASACCNIVFSKAEEDNDKRLLIKFNPREWVIDCEPEEGFLIYRSRDYFIAIADKKSFKMKRILGGSELLIKSKKPVIEEHWSPPVEIPSTDDGWFIATME